MLSMAQWWRKVSTFVWTSSSMRTQGEWASVGDEAKFVVFCSWCEDWLGRRVRGFLWRSLLWRMLHSYKTSSKKTTTPPS